MNRTTPRSLVAVALTASLLVGLITSTALAATPPVYLSVVASPASATQGALVGFTVTVDNRGTSNASQSAVDATIPTGTTYTGVFPASTNCTPSTTDVICSLGGIPGGTKVVFALAFQTTSTTPTPVTISVSGTTTGTPSDKGGNSHGDSFQGSPATASTSLISSTNNDFRGRFLTDLSDLGVADLQTVGATNLQATRLTAPGIGIGASVQDGPGVADLGQCTINSTVCGSLFGQNSAIFVAEGTTFATPFPVTVTFSKYEIPGGINQNNIAIYHTWIDASNVLHEEVISQRCTFDAGSSTPNNAQCLTVVKTSDGLTVTVWLFHNGNVHGW